MSCSRRNLRSLSRLPCTAISQIKVNEVSNDRLFVSGPPLCQIYIGKTEGNIKFGWQHSGHKDFDIYTIGLVDTAQSRDCVTRIFKAVSSRIHQEPIFAFLIRSCSAS